ncbi:TonB-dependent receptor [Flavobacteriaceae bacterium F89]|uniref:TonB-dependent receptor n=1 Tax=Cerina litoralis TaxID=2874477 RepID=A0AAE3EV35_9FLAO|nr:TonB-dependent receptor [Cerina litoralis]MCG2461660.1 TonB-dependent receptor [Cerina litoralis]
MEQKLHIKKVLSNLLFILLFAFGMHSIRAQETVTGSITDINGPLPGVNIVEKGTGNGTVSDFDGNYSISVSNSSSVLVFTYIGYTKQEVPVNGRSTVNVEMLEDAENLSEVVVVGYGTQRKADLTGAVGSIGSAEIVSKPITSPDQALAGTIAGVNITNRSGDPAAPISVQIRGIGTPGTNDPLWVIDGVPIVQTTNMTVNTSSTTDSNPLAGLNSNDIESIDVLKDAASAAIYGARAANGVIIVTTKRGKSGDAKVNLDGYTSFSQARDFIDVLNVEQYIDIQGQLGRDVTQFSGQPFVDWQDAVFRTGFVQNHNVSVSGGSEKANYFISGGYMDQEGIELAQAFTRYSFKANSDIKVGKLLRFGESILLSQTDRLVQSEDAIYAGFNSSLNAPYFKIYGDGPYGYNLENPETRGDGSGTNYVMRTDTRVNETTIQNRKVLANFYGELNILEGLKLRTSLGIDYNVGSNEFFQHETTYDGNSTRQSLKVSSRPIELTLTNDITLNYNTTFGGSDHNLTALFGFEQTKFRFDKVRVQGSNLFNPNFATSGTTMAATQEADIWTLQGWLGRVSYNYQGKYLATANIRRDATSRFSEDNRTGTFPSVSAGWRISQEDFFPKDGFVDNLKIRAGWGQSGNQFTGLNFAYLSALNSNIRYVIGTGQNTIMAPAPTSFANPDLKWETSTQTDIGVDATFMNGNLALTFDYYNKTTNDVLLGLPIPFVSGFFLPTDANIGEIKNSGIELTVNYNGHAGDFNYSVGGNLTTVKNEVTDLGDIPQIITGIGGAQTHRTIEGESMGHFYGFKTDGLYQNQAEVDAALPDAFASTAGRAPGDIRFVDVNGDGQIDADDRTYLGSPFPGFYYGLDFQAEYKGWDFSMNLRGVGDKQIYNSSRQSLEGMQGSNNFSTQILNRWTSEGSTNSSSSPRLTRDDPNSNNRYSDRWIEDAGYLRIQNIQIGYSLPTEKLTTWSKGFVSRMRFYAGAQNLATFTNYTGYDPEVGRTQSFQKGEFNLATGQDGGASPLPRIVQLGWSVTFN